MELREFTRETLRGLSGVRVIVENLRKDAAEAGLDVNVLQTDVESKLTQASIRVLNRDQWKETPGRPWLYVSVNTMKYLASYFFSLDLQLKQEVALRRDTSLVTSSATWEIGSVGFVGIDGLPEKIRDSVGSSMDEFISDYLVANSDA